MKYHVILLVLLISLASTTSVKASGAPPNMTQEMTISGLTGELGQTNNKEYGYHGYLTFKTGFYGLLGFMLNTEIGYQSERESMQARLGIEPQFLIIGLKLDYLYNIDTDHWKANHGLLYGLSLNIPSKNLYYSVYIGREYFPHLANEYVLGISVLYKIKSGCLFK